MSSSMSPTSCVEKNWIAPDAEGGTALPISEGTWMSPERKKQSNIFKYRERREWYGSLKTFVVVHVAVPRRLFCSP